ncbi:thioredoxin family protein [Cognataquiflexum rubidum]|uniref:thioredoxin family protein n=1 Tax=Cognataquiflexum rubidum TaxID=2922273 RepID=UPI001F13CCDC|nr:thioredoxin family protein [Cognataquiflexum rubidum]MCH6236014.1 thioredoxin family protein [Cognataquiflexum rubidum]
MIEEITEDNLQAIIEGNDRVVVQFSAGWCGNCKVMKPKFKRFASEHEDISFVVVDAEKFPNSRKLAKVDNLPTFASYKGGSLLNQIQTNKAELLKGLIDEIASN